LTGSAFHPERRRRRLDFQSLTRFRIMDVLLVSSPYDAFVLEEAGELSERLLGEFRNLDLHYPPGLTVVSTGAGALELARRDRRFNLIITAPYLVDMTAEELARQVDGAGLDVPVALLARNPRELADLTTPLGDRSHLDGTFLWQGDASILVGIIKSIEDRRNVAHDTAEVGVQVILVVEDNIRAYSSFLPVIYAQLLEHSQRVIEEGFNISQKILRMRARPKILLCRTYEEARTAFEIYQDFVLGVISDVEFPRGGVDDPHAGAELARTVRSLYPDIPIILHSSRPENRPLAESVDARFLLKGSPTLLKDLRQVMLQDFGFGDFVFRLADGTEVARAADLKSLAEVAATVPQESILFHGSQNHFSRWLKARTEFDLADALRPRKASDYPDAEALRRDLIDEIDAYRRDLAQGVVADFSLDSIDRSVDFYRLGGGSLGGKARGLAFVRQLLLETGLDRHFQGIELGVPETAVVGTEVFTHFLEDNDLHDFAIQCEDREELEERFLGAEFPEEAARDVAAFLERSSWPLAVRSSSLLEDSAQQPFTGVYETYVLPNEASLLADPVEQALVAVRKVYASAFSPQAKGYLRSTPFRLEEEKMAVILQRLVGSRHGERFYPSFSGIARSHNFYPAPPAAAEDGVAAVALGLGRAIAEGGECVRFSPRYPQHLPAGRDALEGSQRGFWALRMDTASASFREEWFELDAAERDGTLAAVGSTYSPEDDTVHDGLGRRGIRLVTFAPVLKQRLFPLAEILAALLDQLKHGVGGEVEIEFAVELARSSGEQHRFGFLQMRPLALARQSEELELGDLPDEAVLCRSSKVLGHGRIEGIRDLVVVDFQRFDRSRSQEAAGEIGRLNGRLVQEGTPYLLIGVGRWGSRDPWLGIPVAWDQVYGAAALVECGLRDLKVTPSQGSHFFHNLSSFNVGFFTVNPAEGDGTLDWEWLDAQPALSEVAHVRHVRLEHSLLVLIDGRRAEGVIVKDARSSA
jgi:CheY-like chemotaxis protein